MDAKKIFAGGSDGCIRCWDITTLHKVYRITAGSDSQVISYKFVPESTETVKSTVEDLADCAGNRWVFVGSNRVHTHDVRALTVATPEISEQGDLLGAPSRKKCSYRKPSGIDYQKWARPGVPMLISGGDDTKLYMYLANTFLDFLST